MELRKKRCAARGVAGRGAALGAWARSVRDTGWDTAYVFFKHEHGGTGPTWAEHSGNCIGHLFMEDATWQK